MDLRHTRARTELSGSPPVTFGPAFGLAPANPGNRVAIRWAASVDDTMRAAVAARLGLVQGEPKGMPAERTWSYVITDASRESLQRIVMDPAVEDTAGIERSALVLTNPEPWWRRAGRTMPLFRLRIFPEFWQPANASAVLYYLCWALPLIVAALSIYPGPRPDESRFTRAWLWSTIALCLVTDALILRDPIEARVGGMAGAPALLAAWLGARAWRMTVAPKPGTANARLNPGFSGATFVARTVIVLALGVVVWSISVAGDWRHRVIPQLKGPGSLADNIAVASMSPPPESQLPTGALAPVVGYVRNCTRPADRVFASWFVPELYFFSQRAFAGGMTVVFGGHWSEPRFQRRSVALLEQQHVPVVLLENRSYDAFVSEYALIAAHFETHYSIARAVAFTSEDAPMGYRVLVTRDRQPSGIDAATMLPCFR